jgi:hypothetical protein
MTTTNDAGTLREKITEIVLGVHEAGYYFGSIGERDARNPYTAPEDTAREILAAVAESMLSDEVIDRTVKITNRSPAITQLTIFGLIEALCLTVDEITEREE